MRIKSFKVKCSTLKPGDLFSVAHQEYWDSIHQNNSSLGEKVYIRTDAPCPPEEVDEDIFLIKILRKKNER